MCTALLTNLARADSHIFDSSSTFFVFVVDFFGIFYSVLYSLVSFIVCVFDILLLCFVLL